MEYKNNTPICINHKQEIVLFCKNPACEYKLVCLMCAETIHKSHELCQISSFIQEEIENSKIILSRVGKSIGNIRILRIKNESILNEIIINLENKKVDIEHSFNQLLIEVSKQIMDKKHKYLNDIQQFISLLKSSSCTYNLFKGCKELLKEGKNIIKQFNLKDYEKIPGIKTELIRIRNYLESELNSEIKNDQSKLISEIESKITLNDEEFKQFCQHFPVNYYSNKNIESTQLIQPEIRIKEKEISEEYNKIAIKAIQESNFLYLLEREYLNICNLSNGKGSKIRIKFNMKNRGKPTNSECIHINSQIYLSGGWENYLSLNTTYMYEISTNNGNFIEKGRLNKARYWHSLVVLKNIYIFGIGGECENGVLSECEIYNVKADMWDNIYPLNRPKHRVAGCAFGDRWIYTFGGCNNKEGAVGDVELLDAGADNCISSLPHWEIISVNLDVFKPIYWAACIQIDNDHILIFGGQGQEKETRAFRYREESYIFQASIQAISAGVKMAKPEKFYNQVPIIYKRKVYIIGSKGNDIHFYDIHSNKFRMIPKKQWIAK